ncbi:tetratricopeptide repeat protein [Aquimarina muelleri]|uniref:tetratricopeptide repeat-containing sensor histidine kinase n=1 Tax=Aquimarina muelleri TaxID=279356 RepID=UPI00040EE6A9|nr:tetratricopeptide repeat-containing sensor histidine kinase [Aquimarina muelleri]MCX2763711.1 tetratricopeptide repeat protein [Aquimarina muelleri]
MIFTFICCEKPNEIVKKEDIKSNLITSYILKAKSNNFSIIQRKSNLDKAYTICSTLDESVYKMDKIHEISIVYYNLEDYNSYRKMNEKALKLSTSLKDSLGIATSFGNLGIYYRTDKIDSSYYYFDKAEQIYSKMFRHEYNHGKVLLDMARILQRTKDYAGSEDLTIRAIEKFELSKNKKFLPLCYTNLGILAKYLERYDEAVGYHLKAIEYAKGGEEEVLQTLISLNNIGTVYKSQQEYDKAKEYYHKGLAYTEFLNKNPKRHSRLIDNLAYVNFLSKDLTNIPDLFYKALKIRDSIDDKYGIATNTLHLAEYYKSIDEDSIARMYAERSRNISLDLHNNEELLGVYLLLSEISDSDIGLQYANKYIALNDSLIKVERLFRDKFARIKFETEEIVEKNQQISKENEILIIAILGLTALFLLGYIIFRQQQSNKELLFAQTQQESNEEIYRLLLNQQIKLEEGRQMEQQRMSEELHDGVLGRLFGVRLSLDGINQRANDGFTEARNKYIDELKAIEKEIRLLSHDLGAETLPSDVAYIDAVENLIGDLCEVHKISFEFNNDEDIDWEGVDDQKKVNLFRILQESMQNIFKHASADLIKINFEYVDGNINLTILDDGVGFNSTKVKRGIGLKNITSRVNQMNGQVQFINDVDTGGTMVSVSVPAKANVAELY